MSVDEKRVMVRGLEKEETKKDLRWVNEKAMKSLQDKELHEFVTRRSLNLFTALKIDTDFLQLDPSSWTEDC